MNTALLPGFNFTYDKETTPLFDKGYRAAENRLSIEHNPYESKSWSCGWLASRVEFLEKILKENLGDEFYQEFCSVE